VQWIVYAVLFGALHPWLFNTLFPRFTREMTVERNAFAVRVGLYLLFGVVVAAATMLFDYAKVRAVVEDRRSMLSAIGAAAGFIRRNAGAAVTLFLLNFGAFVLTIGVYALVAPGAGRAGLMMWLGLGVGQVYVITRLWIKLTFWASETALFQGRLGHAGYVTRAEPVWPESPAADAI
jgi:hypothetical protein